MPQSGLQLPFQLERMNIGLVLSGLKVAASIQDSCQQFPAIFVGVIDQSIDAPDAFFIDDPDLYFFKEIMKFREDAIQHTYSDAIKFFSETYGLDFSLSDPNEKNQYVYENATMSPYRFTDDIEFLVILNNWIQSGSYGGADDYQLGVDGVGLLPH
jgi:hypothetical protein